MKITEYGIKDRQLQKEGHAQKASAEQKEYEQASGHKRITENNTVIAKHQGSRTDYNNKCNTNKKGHKMSNGVK
jgi:hypothetical protein